MHVLSQFRISLDKNNAFLVDKRSECIFLKYILLLCFLVDFEAFDSMLNGFPKIKKEGRRRRVKFDFRF